MSECSCDCSCNSGINCSSGCVDNDAPASVYACAGASNVGIISFELTKALHMAGKYKMGCSVCVGAGDCSCGSVTDSEQPKDLLIDGCAVACLKKMFDKQGKTHYNHVIVTQLGIKKEGIFSYPPDTIEILMQKLDKRGL